MESLCLALLHFWNSLCLQLLLLLHLWANPELLGCSTHHSCCFGVFPFPGKSLQCQCSSLSRWLFKKEAWSLEDGQCGVAGVRTGSGGESQCPPIRQELYPDTAVQQTPGAAGDGERFGAVTVVTAGPQDSAGMKGVLNPGKWVFLHQYLTREIGSFRNVCNSELSDNISELRDPKGSKSVYK